MFESLKHWFSTDHHDHLFNHPEDAKIHVALASMLYHIMDADHRCTEKEQKLFTTILKDEFDLNDKQVGELYEYVSLLKSDLKTDLETVSEYLKDTPTVRMAFMEKLIHLINVDGIQTGELDIFYEAMATLFPDIPGKSSMFKTS